MVCFSFCGGCDLQTLHNIHIAYVLMKHSDIWCKYAQARLRDAILDVCCHRL